MGMGSKEMLVYVVIGDRKYDGSYIFNIHKQEKRVNEEVRMLNDYNKEHGVKTRYHLEIVGLVESE